MNPQTKARLNKQRPILDVVKRWVFLEERESYWTGCCPVHSDSTPSFCVWPLSGRWKCWTCNEGGDALDFVRWVTGCSFKDALDVVAPQVGEAQALQEQAEQHAAEGDPQPARPEREFGIAVRLHELGRSAGFDAAERAAQRVDALLEAGAVEAAEDALAEMERENTGALDDTGVLSG